MREGGECGFSYMPDKPDDTRKKNLNRLQKLTVDNSQVKFLQPMDVTNDEHIGSVMNRCCDEFGKIDFLLHSIAFALPTDLKGDTIATSREGFKLAMEISVYSLIALANAAQEVLNDNASILSTLTYFGGEKTVPGYNVMGICKAALDSTVKYLAHDLGPRGIRVNALSAGPLQTISGRGAGVDQMLKFYAGMAPLGRNITHEETGDTGSFLLSSQSSGITGEILHLDAGYNSMGSPRAFARPIQRQIAILAASQPAITTLAPRANSFWIAVGKFEVGVVNFANADRYGLGLRTSLPDAWLLFPLTWANGPRFAQRQLTVRVPSPRSACVRTRIRPPTPRGTEHGSSLHRGHCAPRLFFCLPVF